VKHTSSRERGAVRAATGLAAFVLAVAIAPSANAQLATPENFTVAFFGDQGLGPNSVAVLDLVLQEGADAVLHVGDFDYADDPASWEAEINATLGADFPYFASAGNHDADFFYGTGGYQELLEARMQRLGIVWEGDLGVQSSFEYGGVFFVLTAPGEFGAEGDGYHDLYIRDQLAADDHLWRVSGWHKNMRLMQVGGKSDETGWGVYEESRRGGAIIATAHEHSYSRTHLLSSVELQTVASTQEPLALAADDPVTLEDEGRSFAFVSGLGGQSIRDQEIVPDPPWWASIYTTTQDPNATYGALFGVFNYEGDPRKARFYFKNVNGEVVDDFLVESQLFVPEPSARLLQVSALAVLVGLRLLARQGVPERAQGRPTP
jgi:hypothetical protein